jgi:glycosyltransferase involved in cell wall biosynthesis
VRTQEIDEPLWINGQCGFLGPLFGQEKDAAYRACDGFILPSLSEGLPMAVLEAWAHAKPVMLTPECNLPEGFTAEAASNWNDARPNCRWSKTTDRNE